MKEVIWTLPTCPVMSAGHFYYDYKHLSVITTSLNISISGKMTTSLVVVNYILDVYAMK